MAGRRAKREALKLELKNRGVSASKLQGKSVRELEAMLRSGPAKPARKKPPRKKPVSRKKPAPRSPSFKLLDGALVVTRSSSVPGGRKRPVAIVKVAPGKNRAFYMSTGTGGMTDTGKWVNFGGFSTLRGGWFIKPKKEHGSKRAYPKVAAFLAKELGSNPEAVLRKYRKRFPNYPTFSEVEDVKRGIDPRDLGAYAQQLNRYLASFGAIEAWRGPGYYGEDMVGTRGAFKTVIAAPRAKFNSKS